MPDQDFHFGDPDSPGEVIIQDAGGANPVTLPNVVTTVNYQVGGDRSESTRFAAGDQNAKVVEGPDPALPITVTINMYDSEGVGVVGSIQAFRRNHTTGKSKEVVIRKRGTGSGLPELVLAPDIGSGMNLEDKSIDYPVGEDAPAAEGSLTWEGKFSVEPEETAQP